MMPSVPDERTAVGTSLHHGRRIPSRSADPFPDRNLPDPDAVRLALHGMPPLVDFDDRNRFGFRLRAVMINIAAHPPHHRRRTAPEQMADSVEGQTIAVQRNRCLLHLIGCAIAVTTRELVLAPSTQPSLPAPGMPGFHHPHAAAARAKRSFLRSTSPGFPTSCSGI
jgi:hypothetical protein